MGTTLGESVHRINVEPAQTQDLCQKEIRVIAWCDLVGDSLVCHSLVQGRNIMRIENSVNSVTGYGIDVRWSPK